jgi:hypothetical protein
MRGGLVVNAYRNYSGYLNSLIHVLVLPFLGCVQSQSDWATVKRSPELVIQQTDINVGDVLPGSKVEIDLQMKNSGSERLAIHSISSSCGCTVAETIVKTIESGSEIPMKITVLCPSSGGEFLNTVTVKTDDPMRPNTTIYIRGKARFPVETDSKELLMIRNDEEVLSGELTIYSTTNEPLPEIKVSCKDSLLNWNVISRSTFEQSVQFSAKQEEELAAEYVRLDVLDGSMPALEIPIRIAAEGGSNEIVEGNIKSIGVAKKGSELQIVFARNPKISDLALRGVACFDQSGNRVNISVVDTAIAFDFRVPKEVGFFEQHFSLRLQGSDGQRITVAGVSSE